jgi:UV DNA damage endonuclease
MILRTYNLCGINYASALALQNSADLVEIIKWNAQHNIRVFRISSGIFPWNSKYKLNELRDYTEICANLRMAGDLAKSTNQRISAHPDHFVKPEEILPHIIDVESLKTI